MISLNTDVGEAPARLGPDRYAVFGHPVAHSKSPLIHAAFARETGQYMTYEAVLVPLDRFRESVARFVAEGGCGANVTLPFKIEAHSLAHELSVRAAYAGAVNTLRFDSGHIMGDNTDGVGLVRDIARLGIAIEDRRVLLLGAGGAARGAVGALLEQIPAQLTIASRTAVKAADLARLFSAPIATCALDALPEGGFDIVINATSASLGGAALQLPDHVFAETELAYDMMYMREPTPFMLDAQARGTRHVADGLGMLVEQAAESFFLWRGVNPQTAAVLAELRGQL